MALRLLPALLLAPLLTQCFGRDVGDTQFQFRLANGSSTQTGDIKKVRISVYESEDLHPFYYASDEKLICGPDPAATVNDNPLYRQDFDFDAHEARILATLPEGEITIILEAFAARVGPDGKEDTSDLILVGRGIKKDVEVKLSGTTDVGVLEFKDALESRRPQNVRLVGRSGRIQVELDPLDPMKGATGYVLCMGTAANSTIIPVVLTGPSGDIDDLDPTSDELGKIVDGAQYFARVFARHEASVSLPAQPTDTVAVVGAAETNASTSPTEEIVVFSVTPQAPVPVDKEPIKNELSTGSAKLSWEAADKATGYCIDSPCFKPTHSTCEVDPAKALALVSDKDSNEACGSPPPLTRRCHTITDPGLVSGRQCDFNIYAMNQDHGLSDAQTHNLVAVAPPRMIDVRARSGEITLNWTPAENADEYVVYVNEKKSGTPYECSMPVPGGKATARLTESSLAPPSATCTATRTVTPGETYYITVQSKAGGTSSSPLSEEVFVTPLNRVETVRAEGATGKVAMKWSPVPNADGYLIYYTTNPKDESYAGSGMNEGTSPICVEISSDKSCMKRPKGKESKLFAKNLGQTAAAGESQNLLTVDLTGVQDGTTYYFAVSGFSNNPVRNKDTADPDIEDESESTFSSQASGTPLAAPVEVDGSAGDGSFSLAWKPATGADSYCLLLACGEGVDPAKCSTVKDEAASCAPASPTRRCFTWTGLLNGVSCKAQVQARRGEINRSDWSSSVSATPVGTPRFLAASGGTDGVSLRWREAPKGVESYVVRYNKGNGGPPYSGSHTVSNGQLVTTSVGGLSNGTPHYFVIQALNTAHGSSSRSNEVTVIPLARPAISSIVAQTGKVTIQWAHVPKATHYDLHSDTDTGSEPFAIHNIVSEVAAQANCPTGFRCHTFTGLASAVPLYVAVQAVRIDPLSTLSAPVDSGVTNLPVGSAVGFPGAKVLVDSEYMNCSGADPTQTPQLITACSRGYFNSAATAHASNVQVHYFSSASSLSDVKSAVPLAVPTNVRLAQLTDVTTTSIKITWDTVAGASGYNAYYGLKGPDLTCTPGTKVAVSGGTTTFMTLSGLTSNSTYCFSVSATNAAGEGGASTPAYEVATLLNLPTNVKLKGGTGRVAVSWKSVSGAAPHMIYRNTVAGQVSTGVGITTAGTCGAPFNSLCPDMASNDCCGVITGLTDGTTYYFSVRAEKAACVAAGTPQDPVTSSNNCGAFTTCTTASKSCEPPEHQAVPLAVPIGLTVTNLGGEVTSDRIDLKWDTDTTFDGFKLYYDTDTNGLPYTGVDSSAGFSPILVSKSATTFSLTGLKPNTNYYTALSVYRGTDPNNPDSESELPVYVAPPGVATDLRRTTLMNPPAAGTFAVAAATDKLTFGWGTVTGATAYEISYGTPDAAPPTGGPGNTLTCTVLGSSSYECKTGSGPPGTQLRTTPTVVPGPPFTAILTNNTTLYYFQVRAKAGANCPVVPPTPGGLWSNVTTTENCSIYTPTPSKIGIPISPPCGLGSSAGTGNSITLDWQPLTNVGCAGGALGTGLAGSYKLHYRLNGQATWNGTGATITGTPANSPITLSGLSTATVTLETLQNNQTYDFALSTVAATPAAGESNLSPVFTATISIEKPKNIYASADQGTAPFDGQSRMRVQWDAVATATDYKLYYSITGDTAVLASWNHDNGLTQGASPITLSASTTCPTNCFIDLDGATGGTLYYFRVTALMGAAEGAPSDGYSVTPFGQPTGLTLIPKSAGAVQVDWTSVGGAATIYEFHYDKDSGPLYTCSGAIPPAPPPPQPPSCEDLGECCAATACDAPAASCVSKISGISANTYNLTAGLSSKQKYYVTILAKDNGDTFAAPPRGPSTSDYANEQQFLAGQVTSLTVTALAGGNAKLQWDKHLYTGGLVYYQVHYGTADQTAVLDSTQAFDCSRDPQPQAQPALDPYAGSTPNLKVGATDVDSCFTVDFNGIDADFIDATAAECNDPTGLSDNIVECTLSGLDPTTTYYFAVRAVTGNPPLSAISPFSSQVEVRPAPTLSSVVPEGGQFFLTWTLVAGATGYKVSWGDTTSDYTDGNCKQFSTAPTFPVRLDASPLSSPDSTGGCTGTLNPGTAYFFSVQTESGAPPTPPLSLFSNEVEARSLSTAVPVTTKAATGKISLSWNGVSGADQYIVAYYRDPKQPPDASQCPAHTTLTIAIAAAATTLPVASAANYDLYPAGITNLVLRIGTEEITCPLAGISASQFTGCARGGGTGAVAHGNGENVFLAPNSIITQDAPNENKFRTKTVPAPSGGTDITGLTAGGARYCIAIRAEHSANNGMGDFTVPVTDTTIGVASGLAATAFTGSVTVSWTTVSAGATKHEIRWDNDNCALLDESPITVTLPANDSGPIVVTNNATYCFVVAGKNNSVPINGEGTQSGSVVATPENFLLGAPTSLTLTAAKNGVEISDIGSCVLGGTRRYLLCHSTTTGVCTESVPFPPGGCDCATCAPITGVCPTGPSSYSCALAPAVERFFRAIHQNTDVTINGQSSFSAGESQATPRYGERTTGTWPFVPGVLDKITSSPAVLNFLTGDSPLEIIVGGTNDNVYLLDDDNTAAWTYTTAPAGDVQSCPAVAEIASTPAGKEVAIANDAGTLFILKNDGTLANSVALAGPAGLSCPAIANLDGDGPLEVAILAQNGANTDLYAYDVSATGVLTQLWAPITYAGDLIGGVGDRRGVTPALAEIDSGCSGYEIVFGDATGNVHVICGATGAEATNCAWPVDANGGAPGGPALNNSPAIARNIDTDLFPEIIVGSEGGSLFKIEANTCATITLLSGLGAFRSSPALANLDADPELEIIVANDNGNLYAVNSDGSAVAGFPISIGVAARTSPVVADLDNDGENDIFLGDSNGLLHGYRPGLAGEIPGFPVPVSSADAIVSSAAIEDLDPAAASGLEIVVGSDDGKVHVIWLENVTAFGPLDVWPTFHGNNQRTGCTGPAICPP